MSNTLVRFFQIIRFLVGFFVCGVAILQKSYLSMDNVTKVTPPGDTHDLSQGTYSRTFMYILSVGASR